MTMDATTNTDTNPTFVSELMAIKIETEKLEAIQAVLNAVNGKAKKHTITDAEDVDSFAYDVEWDLRNRGVTLKAMRGVIAIFTPAGPRAASYRYKAETTRIDIERRSSGWYLINVERVPISAKQPEFRDVDLTYEAMKCIVTRSMEGLGRTSKLQAKKMLCNSEASLKRRFCSRSVDRLLEARSRR